MQVHIIYFVHGATYDNEKGLYTGWYDVELSPLGIEQSKRLREQLAGRHFDVIICSDRRRAVDSARLTWGDAVPIITDERLREVNLGELDRSAAKWIDPMMADHIEKRFPGGESYRDVERRMRSFLDDLRRNYAGKRVAIVAHRAPQLALDVILKAKTWEQAIAEDWRHKKAWQPGWEYEA
jgi:broad specificity phosphatase PhoE